MDIEELKNQITLLYGNILSVEEYPNWETSGLDNKVLSDLAIIHSIQALLISLANLRGSKTLYDTGYKTNIIPIFILLRSSLESVLFARWIVVSSKREDLALSGWRAEKSEHSNISSFLKNTRVSEDSKETETSHAEALKNTFDLIPKNIQPIKLGRKYTPDYSKLFTKEFRLVSQDLNYIYNFTSGLTHGLKWAIPIVIRTDSESLTEINLMSILHLLREVVGQSQSAIQEINHILNIRPHYDSLEWDRLGL